MLTNGVYEAPWKSGTVLLIMAQYLESGHILENAQFHVTVNVTGLSDWDVRAFGPGIHVNHKDKIIRVDVSPDLSILFPAVISMAGSIKPVQWYYVLLHINVRKASAQQRRQSRRDSISLMCHFWQTDVVSVWHGCCPEEQVLGRTCLITQTFLSQEMTK